MVKLERLLFSAEFLKPGEVLEKGAVELLNDTGTMLSLKQSFEELKGQEFKAMMDRFKDLGHDQGFIPWPMLPVKDGYYANELSVEKFTVLVKDTLDWYCDNDFEVPLAVLVDLEPPADPKEVEKAEKIRKGLIKKEKKKGFDIMSIVGKIIDGIDENVNQERFEKASRKFTEMQDMMHDYGTRALAVALPMAYEDIFDDKLLLQDFMTCPVTSVEWDMINFMIFNTDYVAATKGLITNEEYRHLLYAYAKEFIDRWGPEKPSITLGITNLGIQDTRAVQTDPELYKQEASALLAAGMRSTGIYALDGVLEQPDPKGWIETVWQADSSDFTVDKEKLEMAGHVRRLFQALDFVAPVAKYLVDSGKIMDIIRMVTSL
ncbi:hypothetical protein GF325_02160 [Candidatus Bathyarchaeota archaeon]|nr:hypothetical protein [Candidatus Bathyarchaeota archaeon]